ncbi:MAG: GlsB/YeaQ/YmgE family stress response membrane protein [Clostridiales bacterium]|nr:GlsB/YeaQ/YmgE family stress response membrane protein [Clostridiales bacterium]
MINILLWLLFGALVGWIAGKLMQSKHSLTVNIIVGILGSIIGGFIASLFHIGTFEVRYSFSLGNIIISIIGACILLFFLKLVEKKG